MKLYNTMTHNKDEFIPIKPNEVSMYVCGVTVYMAPHLGHARTYVGYDIIKEYFTNFMGYKVNYIRNITDVGSVVGDADEGADKIELKANEMKMHPLELVDKNIENMWNGLDALRCARPNISPRATGHIVDIIESVQKMIDNGYAYELAGNVYCDVSKIKEYGCLSGNTLEALNAGARIKVDDGKHSPYDFTVWKKAKPNSVLKWNSPWGVGYPGWHIECSVMSTKYLGDTFDIHGGGRELAFPHHENEIAQNKAICGHGSANYWVHSGMLNVNGTKMSKSLGNFITIEDALKKWGARSLRWFFVNVHYNSPVNFSEEALRATDSGLERIDNFIFNLKNNYSNQYSNVMSQRLQDFTTQFLESMNDDFNTPNAIAGLFDFIKEANAIISTKQYNQQNVDEVLQFLLKIDTVFKSFDSLYNKDKKDDRESKVALLIEERNIARSNKDWTTADKIKQQILDIGAEIFDNKDGSTTFKLT